MVVEVEKIEETAAAIIYEFQPIGAPGGRVYFRRLADETPAELAQYATSVVLVDHRESARYVLAVLDALQRRVEAGAFPQSLVVRVDSPETEPPSPLAVAMAMPGRHERVVARGILVGGTGGDDAA